MMGNDFGMMGNASFDVVPECKYAQMHSVAKLFSQLDRCPNIKLCMIVHGAYHNPGRRTDCPPQKVPMFGRVCLSESVHLVPPTILGIEEVVLNQCHAGLLLLARCATKDTGHEMARSPIDPMYVLP